MITTTKGMLHRVHTDSRHLGPAVSFHFVLVIGIARLQQRFLRSSSSGHHAHHGPAESFDNLLLSRWKTNHSLSAGSLRHNGSHSPRCSNVFALVIPSRFQITNQC